MGEIEKVDNLESQNLSIENYLRNTGIEKYHISFGQNFSIQDEKV
jgi:hypothetical protein